MDQYFFKTAFGVSGDLTAIPRASQPSGDMSYTDGFTSDYSLPNSNPSRKKVPRPQTNQLYYAITQNLQQYQIFGTPEWITAANNDAVAYSYAKGARVQYTDGAVWVSLVNSNSSEPSTDATKWQLAATVKTTAGCFDNVVPVTSTPYTILPADIGKLHIFSGSASVVYLPAIASVLPGNAFPMTNISSANVTINRDGSSTLAGVNGSTTAFILSPYSSATPAKSDTAVWTVEGLIGNNTIGFNQSWQDVTGSRAKNVTYTNTTGRPIQVNVSCSIATNGNYSLTVGGVLIQSGTGYSSTTGSSVTLASAIVPVGATYIIQCTGSISVWAELR